MQAEVQVGRNWPFVINFYGLPERKDALKFQEKIACSSVFFLPVQPSVLTRPSQPVLVALCATIKFFYLL